MNFDEIISAIKKTNKKWKKTLSGFETLPDYLIPVDVRQKSGRLVDKINDLFKKGLKKAMTIEQIEKLNKFSYNPISCKTKKKLDMLYLAKMNTVIDNPKELKEIAINSPYKSKTEKKSRKRLKELLLKKLEEAIKIADIEEIYRQIPMPLAIDVGRKIIPSDFRELEEKMNERISHFLNQKLRYKNNPYEIETLLLQIPNWYSGNMHKKIFKKYLTYITNPEEAKNLYERLPYYLKEKIEF